MAARARPRLLASMRYLIALYTEETHAVTRALAEAGFPLLGNLFVRGKGRRSPVLWTVEVADPAAPKLEAIRVALSRLGFAHVRIEPDRRDRPDRRQQ
jgi:hypothetical protein